MKMDQGRGAEGLRRLHALMRRVNSSADETSVLDEIVSGVVDVLGFGVAVISRVEGDELLTASIAGREDVKAQLTGRRTPIRAILDEFTVADQWGVLRFVPHDRIPTDVMESAWVPNLDYCGEEGEWHPLDALYAPLYSANGQLLGNMAVDLPPNNKIPSQEDAELLEMFVVQAGLALAHARQREVLAAQVLLSEAIQAVGAAYRLEDFDGSMRRAAAIIESALGVGRAWINVHGDGTTLQWSADQVHSTDGQLPDPQEWAALMETFEPLDGAGHDPVVLEVADAPDAVASLIAAQGGDRLMALPLRAADHQVGHLVVVRQDGGDHPTETTFDALRQVSRELGRIVLNNRTFETERRLVSELQQVDRYKSELIATISHELKTPLASIIGHVELLEDLDTGINSVEVISRNAARLNGLINNLLSYSSLQERRERERKHVGMVALCHQTIESLSRQVDAVGVQIAMPAGQAELTVCADPAELSQVVDNIVVNALKYTPVGGRVEVGVSRADDKAVITCTDTGLGIAEQDLKHLFSAFYRSSNPAALSIPGTGLGLAISRRIVELHGGELSVESTLGQGSTFTLTLPLSEAG